VNKKKKSKNHWFPTFEKKIQKKFACLKKKNKRIVNFGYNFKNLKILVGFMKEPTKKNLMIF
jgi:hypothetical protein